MKTIVFDFDGTIANTLESITAIYNELAPRFGCKHITPADLERLKNGHPREFMQEFRVSYWKLPFLVWGIKKSLKKQIANLPLQPGMPEVIQDLHKKDFKLGILTSNSTENVHVFLRAHGLDQLFDFVLSHRGIFGKHTPLQKLKHAGRASYYVGDEVRDIEAAKKADISTVAVSWGFQTERALKAAKPDYLFNEVSELLELP